MPKGPEEVFGKVIPERPAGHPRDEDAEEAE